jgi:hypothetical protein
MVSLKRFVLMNCLASLGLFSCAYHAGDSRSPTEILRVFVPVIENVSVRPIDLNELTSSWRESLEAVRGVVVVTRREDADLLILGKVNVYNRTWGPTAYKGTPQTAKDGGLRADRLSASTARVYFGMQIEKRSPSGELLWTSNLLESDLYELSDRIELKKGSAAMPQIHASREALLVKKLAERIFERVQAQIVDNF